jgi:uncharacterized protein (TIGR02246 family)
MTAPILARAAALAALSLATLAATGEQSPAPAAWSADEAEIRRQLADSVAAFNDGDLAGHLAIYAEDVRFMTKQGPRRGIAPIEKAFREAYFKEGKPKQRLRFEELAVRPVAADAAIATARFVLSGGEKPEQSGWFTLVWTRTPAGWKAVHDHSS